MSDPRSRPAFPVPPASRHEGVSQRDWFAAMALQGLLAKGLEVRGDRAFSALERDQMLAERAYQLADAMVNFSAELTAPT